MSPFSFYFITKLCGDEIFAPLDNKDHCTKKWSVLRIAGQGARGAPALQHGMGWTVYGGLEVGVLGSSFLFQVLAF